MKNILKSFLAISAVAAILASCAQIPEYASKVSADKTAIEFDGENPVATTISVTADGDWYIFAPAWLEVTPSHGSGNTTVTIAAEKNLDNYNELNAPRSVNMAVCGQSEYFTVVVSQKGASGLDATKHFKKITSMDEFDPAYAYLIVAEVDKSLLACMPCEAETDNSSKYAYMFPTSVTADDEGTVTMDNGSLSFYLEPVEGGYALRQSKGNYLYQSASYANFYTCSTVDKASVWTLSFNAAGNAILTNTSAGDRILEYDAANYKDFGAWAGDLQSGYQYPVLYKDSAMPNDEIISAPEATYVLATATSASIAVTSNKTWTVRCHDSWVNLVTKAGEGNGNIELTFEPNTTAEARTATLKVIGEYTNFDITLTQSAPMTTIKELNEWAATKATSYSVTLKDAVVTYVNGSNAFIEDATAGVLLYLSKHGLTAGQSINGTISGKVTLYNGLVELTSMDKSEATIADGATIPCTTVTIEKLLSDFNSYVNRRVKIEGISVETGVATGARSGKVSQGDKKIDMYAKYNGVEMIAGSKGDLICYPDINNSSKRLGVWETSYYTMTSCPGVITCKDNEVVAGKTVALGAKANSGATLSYESLNPAIATVNAAGTVTGVAEGEATIRISAPASGIYTAASLEVKVKVTAPSSAPTKTITLAGSFTFDSAAKTLTLTQDGVTVVQAQGTSSTAPNSSYATATTLRIYDGNTVTFSCAKNIVKIVFTHPSNYAAGANSASNVGTYTRGSTSSTWEGSATSVTITNTKEAGASNIQLRPSAIEVTFEE